MPWLIIIFVVALGVHFTGIPTGWGIAAVVAAVVATAVLALSRHARSE